MVEIEIVRAAPEHVEPIAARMRQADRREVEVSGRAGSVEQALAFSVERSDYAFTVMMEGRPEIAFGVGTVSVLPSVGAPWLLGTDAVERQARRFLRESRPWLDALQARFDVLRNVVHVENALSVAWLRWLGFRFSAPMPIGRGGALFMTFERRATHV